MSLTLVRCLQENRVNRVIFCLLFSRSAQQLFALSDLGRQFNSGSFIITRLLWKYLFRLASHFGIPFATSRVRLLKRKKEKQDKCHQWSTGPDPHSLSSNEHCFRLNFVLFWKMGTDGRTTCAKTMIATGRDCGSAEWINKTPPLSPSPSTRQVALCKTVNYSSIQYSYTYTQVVWAEM